MSLDIPKFKTKLECEKANLEKELSTVAHHKKDDIGWEAVGTIIDESIDADPNDVADKIEEFETNQAIVESLKEEMKEVSDALARIEAGTFGICEVCGKHIEEARMDANSSARTCIEHMNHVFDK